MRPTERPAPSRGPDPHPGPGWRARLPAALKASGAWRKTGAAAFLLLLAAACLPDRAPSGLALMTGAHPDSPVLLQSLRINTVDIGGGGAAGQIRMGRP